MAFKAKSSMGTVQPVQRRKNRLKHDDDDELILSVCIKIMLKKEKDNTDSIVKDFFIVESEQFVAQLLSQWRK